MKILSTLILSLVLGIAGAVVHAGEKQIDIRLAGKDFSEDMAELNEDLSEMGLEIEQLVKSLRMLGDKQSANRAFIGILLEEDGEDEAGVHVIGVTPEGPAQQAGIKTGDVIISINGESLARDADHRPASKLHHSLKAVQPGDTLTIGLERDGESRVIELVAAKRADHLQFGINIIADDIEKRVRDKLHRFDRGPLSGIELYSLNKGLGSYFNTESGMLVLHVPGEDAVVLKSGDVILEIGGRAPKSPSQAWRIINSYDSGDSIPLRIMRNREPMDLTLVLP
jgi:S1-C subfamily serine protease